MESGNIKRAVKLSKCGNSMDVCLGDRDRISELPDEVLENILSHLTLREAVSSSLISRRWKLLWTYSTGSFDFDFGTAALTAMRQKPCGSSCISDERIRYIDRVYKILQSHRGPTMEAFIIKFDLINDSTQQINTWIDFAMRKRVRRLELDLRRVNHNPLVTHDDIDMCYSFPSQESLDSSWLTHLTLNTVNMSRETAEYIFSNCSNLENVNISRSPSLSAIRVVDTCPKLKHLEISHCQCLEFLEICSAPSLISLSYSGPRETRLCFGDVPNLVDVSLLGKYCTYKIWKFHELPLPISQIQKLKLGPTMEMSPCFSKFPKLKSVTELEMVFDAVDEESLYSCTNAIEACPNLCRLSVQFRWMWEPKQRRIREAKLAKGRRYKRLKVVEFRGFRGSATDVEIATYVLSMAVFLEKIIVNTVDSNQTLKSSSTSTRTSTSSDDNYLAKLVALQLAAKFSPAAQLIIF